MKRVLEIILFGLITYGLLTLCSCSRDELEIIEPEIIEPELSKVVLESLGIPTPTVNVTSSTTTNEINTSWETDEFYSRLIDPNSTPNDYLEVF